MGRSRRRHGRDARGRRARLSLRERLHIPGALWLAYGLGFVFTEKRREYHLRRRPSRQGEGSHDRQPGKKEKAERELKKDADNYRLLQATELLLRFKEQHGRKPQSMDELEAWVAEPSSNIESPIKPRNGLELPKEK